MCPAATTSTIDTPQGASSSSLGCKDYVTVLPSIVAVDLAAKYSAACRMDTGYQVIDQFDSWQISEQQFIWRLTDMYADAEYMVIEDLPHGLKYSTLVKTVCRLQGRIFHACMHESKYADEDIIFAAPAEWRKHYDLKRGTGPEIVVPTAAEFGYTPPDLSERAKGIKGGKAIARKVATDYCSAYLIARWAQDMKGIHGTYNVVGTSRYNTEVIRKKDVDDKDS